MDERHRELAKRMGVEHSERMAALFEMIANDDETDILVALPSTAPALAEKMSRNEQELTQTLHELFLRGLVTPSMKTDPPTYRLTHNVITFHDATALWSGATTEYRDLWREFMDEEWPELSKTLTQAFRPATRIIPVGIAVEAQSRVLAFEDVKEIINNARVVTVTDCPCRLTERKCDKPLEVCLHFDKIADYDLARGVGRELTKAQALDLMRMAEEAGLVHMVTNQHKATQIICNCCTCCCVTMPTVGQQRVNLPDPSRFLARIDADLCSACEACLDRCIFGAIEMTDGPDGEVAVVDPDKCMGCGVCQVTCPEEAISLEDVRSRDFIPERIWR
jgi:ferredoxin